MTLREYWEILRNSWLMVLLATLVGGGVAFGVSQAMTPVYQAQAQIFVSVLSSPDDNTLASGTYLLQRMKSYAALVDSPAVLDPVKVQVDPEGTQDLNHSITVTNPVNTVLLQVNATNTDPERAAAAANAAAASLAKEIGRLETTATGAKPVKAEVIKPAEEPTSPESPRTKLNLVLGALLGLMVGVGIALLRHVLDTSVKSPEALAEATRAAPLGAVTFDPEASKNPLVTLRDNVRGEPFRTLRTNLRFVDVDNPPHTVVITSAVPNEGKTTTACNLAIALAQGGSKVLLLEGDLRRPKAAIYLGVDHAVGVTDILIGRIPLDDAITPWEDGLLDFLAAGAIPPNPSELLGSHQMSELLGELAQRYDIVVIDSPPLLLVSDAAILAASADGAILVSRFGKTKVEQAGHAAEALHQVGARLLGTVLNFVPVSRGRRGKYGYGYGGYGYGGYGQSGDVAASAPATVRPAAAPPHTAEAQPTTDSRA